MAVKKEKLARDSEAARRRPVELITENGFSLVRSSEIDNAIAQTRDNYTFLVRDPDGYELEIAVSIDRQLADEIIWRSRGSISAESSFWICCAERHLAEYLWENNDYPANAFLKVELLTLDDLDQARRWDHDD
ncbi:MAG: hypothetical protein ACMG6H_10740 [Acidobacteriota bacterium]